MPCSSFGIFPVYSFLPLRFDLSGLGVGAPSQSLELALDWLRPLSIFSLLFCLWSDLLFLVLGVPAPNFFQCAWQALSSFLLWFGYSFDFWGSSLGSYLLLVRGGGLTWVEFFLPVGARSWSFCPLLKVVDSSLGSGKVLSPVFVGPFPFCLFNRCGHSVWFLKLFLLGTTLGIRKLSFSWVLLLVLWHLVFPCLSLWFQPFCGFLGRGFLFCPSFPPLAGSFLRLPLRQCLRLATFW